MRAIVFKDFGSVELADVPTPTIEYPDDAVVRVTTTAICGSDLHVLNGRIPGMTPGSTMGHEFIGIVEDAGPEVVRFRPGDRVVGSFTIPDGTCWFCQRGLYSRCPDQAVFGYGAFLGDVQGCQAERVRVPSANLALHNVDPALTDEQALFVGDIFSTGVDCAAEAQIQPGDTVAVLGCGPVGLMAVQAARAFDPAIVYAVDTVPDRLEMAQTFGAVPVDAGDVHVASHIQDETDGRGADRVLECVGSAGALHDALDVVRAGGRIAVMGVHSEPEFDLPLNMAFVRGVDLKFCGTANVIGRWDRAFELISSGAAHPDQIISHRMKLDDGVRGYELFASREAMKVVLTP